MVYAAMKSHRYVPAFRRQLLSSSSGQKIMMEATGSSILNGGIHLLDYTYILENGVHLEGNRKIFISNCNCMFVPIIGHSQNRFA